MVWPVMVSGSERGVLSTAVRTTILHLAETTSQALEKQDEQGRLEICRYVSLAVGDMLETSIRVPSLMIVVCRYARNSLRETRPREIEPVSVT